MNRFIKFLLWGLITAPLLTGCTSARFTSTIKNQDFKNTEAVKFNIEAVSLDYEGPFVVFYGAQYKKKLTGKLLMKEAEKAYPELFAAKGNIIPVELKIRIKRSDRPSFFKYLLFSLYGIIPSTFSVKEDIKLDVKIRDESNELLLRKTSDLSLEATRWMTMFTPLGLIPIPGESDIPKLTGIDQFADTKGSEPHFVRRSIVNGIVKTLKDSDMKKMLASYKRSKRMAEANKHFKERLLKGESSLAMYQSEEKKALVLMPLRASGIAAANRPAMESAIASGLSNRYKVYFGKRVADKVREIYTAATSKAKAGEECDDTMCMQDIGIS
ncbi:MAG: hypothetical protein IMF07_07890, partial [Proteobacteria bacterium]|nr:hypothetical protein [Pseudomonadota bacterium]